MEQTIASAFDLDVEYLTIWGASTANVTERDPKEIDFLFSVFKNSFEKLIASPEISDRRVRVRILGEWRVLFPEPLKKVYEDIIEKTEKNDGPSLTFMMAYSGTGEILRAVDILRATSPDIVIDRDSIKRSLMTHDLPAVDLVIRTGGEPHWSDGFMMWDTANSQLYFTETLWPDFSKEELAKVVEQYRSTERRMGK